MNTFLRKADPIDPIQYLYDKGWKLDDDYVWHNPWWKPFWRMVSEDEIEALFECVDEYDFGGWHLTPFWKK